MYDILVVFYFFLCDDFKYDRKNIIVSKSWVCICSDNFLNNPHMESSPYGAVYLSPPPDNNWRRWVVHLSSCWLSLSSLLTLMRFFNNRNCFLLPACFLFQTSLSTYYYQGTNTQRLWGSVTSELLLSLFLQKCFKYQDAVLALGSLHLTKDVWQIAFCSKGHSQQQ